MNEEFNPYKILNVTESSLERHKDNVEKYLEDRKNQMIRLGVESEDIEKAYEILADKYKRNNYLEQIKKNRIFNEQELNKAYNFRNKYDEHIIKNFKFVKDEIKETTFKTGENSYIILKPTGEIVYDTALGLGDKVQEYEVSKVKNGIYTINKKKVYSNIDMQKLLETEIDEKGENVIKDPEYRNDVLRHLLSRERIKSCLEYNHGYLGEVVEKDYEDRLDPYTIKINREHYSAVMKYYGERSYEPRHAIKEEKAENKINDTKKDLEDDEFDR